MDYGLSLVVLGVRCKLSLEEMCLFPEPCKVHKWAAGFRDALGKDLLSAGASQKLAGRLSWAQTHLFHKLGRAMQGPIFDQRCSRSGKISKVLRAALLWWLHVLEAGVCEMREWNVRRLPLFASLSMRAECHQDAPLWRSSMECAISPMECLQVQS